MNLPSLDAENLFTRTSAYVVKNVVADESGHWAVGQLLVDGVWVDQGWYLCGQGTNRITLLQHPDAPGERDVLHLPIGAKRSALKAQRNDYG